MNFKDRLYNVLVNKGGRGVNKGNNEKKRQLKNFKKTMTKREIREYHEHARVEDLRAKGLNRYGQPIHGLPEEKKNAEL